MKKDVTLEDLMEFMVEKLATKSDLADMDTKLDQVRETLDGHTLILNEHTQILNQHTQTLNEHTRDLNTIKKDVERNLDKRMMLEVRVTNIEKHVGLPTP